MQLYSSLNWNWFAFLSSKCQLSEQNDTVDLLELPVNEMSNAV